MKHKILMKKKTIKSKYYAMTFTWEPYSEDDYWRGYVDRMMEEAEDWLRHCYSPATCDDIESDYSYELACMYALARGGI